MFFSDYTIIMDEVGGSSTPVTNTTATATTTTNKNTTTSTSAAKGGLPPALKIGLIIAIGLIVLVVVFRQVPRLKKTKVGRFLRGGKKEPKTDLEDKKEPETGTAKTDLEDKKEPETDGDKKEVPVLPPRAGVGISEGNLVEIEGANNHEACKEKAKEANYAGFAMKVGDDGKFTKCFGYSTEMSYPLTKEFDTSYTACADPAMEVANSCAASMEGEGEGEGESIDPPELNIEYPEDSKYILAAGKGIEDPLDSAAANYTNFSKTVDQCLQECNEDDIGCTGIQFTNEGECIIFDQTTAFPTPSEYIDNQNGALYRKILAPEGYKVDNPGKDYAGKPIATLRNVDIGQCKKKCDEDKTCAGFSMYNSGKCQPKTKSALKGQLLTRPSGSTFYTKNAKLMKPQEIESGGVSSANDFMVQEPEVIFVPPNAFSAPASTAGARRSPPASAAANKETYVPEWLNAKKKPKGKFLR